MDAGVRVGRAGLIFAPVSIGVGARGFAQTDLGGQWRPLLHEDRAFVPHYLPGANPGLMEYAAKVGLLPEVTQGGAETTYPEYQQTLEVLMSRRAKASTR